jgi:hypothetical protein
VLVPRLLFFFLSVFDRVRWAGCASGPVVFVSIKIALGHRSN